MNRIFYRLKHWVINLSISKEKRYIFYFQLATVLMIIETIITKNGIYLFGILACVIVLHRFLNFHAKKRNFTLLDLFWIKKNETKDN